MPASFWNETIVRRASIVVGVMVLIVYAVSVAPPIQYPIGTVIHVKDGASISSVAEELESKGLIQSSFVFKISMVLVGASVQQGMYAFSRPETVLTIAFRLHQGKTGIAPVKVTIPEGSTSWDIAEVLSDALPDFDVNEFKVEAKKVEGKLYPETYFFPPGAETKTIIETMIAEYERALRTVRDEIEVSGKSEKDIIIMASLLEKEARKEETMKIVSGILWKRLSIGMPLQVDAVFGYIHERDTYSPSFDDLSTTSPYNTYRNRGLPPGPIANPGMQAIRAALHPTETPYLYYLTGNDGAMYYAKTFEQHKANRIHLK